MTKYEQMLRGVKPDPRLIPWLKKERGRLKTHGIVYRRQDLREPLTGLKQKAVLCRCSACGGSWYEDYAAGPSCSGAYAKAPYGILRKAEILTTGDSMLCEECGVGSKLYYYGHMSHCSAIEYVWSQELRVIDKIPVLLQWRHRILLNSDGVESENTEIYNAFCFEKKKAVRLCGYGSFMGNTYCIGYLEEKKQCRDDYASVTNFLPFDPEILNGTVLENAKLDLYLAAKGKLYPVSYLRLYQKYHKVETLLTAGAGDLLAEMISEQWKDGAGYQQRGCSRIPRLELIDWKAKRPSSMLHLNREELRKISTEGWSYEALRSYIIIRDKTGERPLKTELQGFHYGEIELLLELKMPVRKTLRYLNKQGKTVYYFRDYLDMAQKAGKNIQDPAVCYPRELLSAHDRAVRMQKYKASACYHQDFLRIAEELQCLAWEHDGILIRAVANERELIDEGEKLSHCVGGYARRHAEGECSILLIRKAEEPDKPWYTLNMNIEKGTVTENRGKRNCGRTPEVEAFEKAWLEHIRKPLEKLQRDIKNKKEETAA